MSPLPRFAKLPAAKQRAILAAAEAEFARHGYSEASFNRIIAAAGVSKGAMYYYFADKADLYRRVLDDVMDRVAASLVHLPAPTTQAEFWSWGDQAIFALSSTLFVDPQLGALGRDMYVSAPSEVFSALQARVNRWAADALLLGQQLGAVRDDFPLDLLVSATTGLLVAIDRWFTEAMDRLPPEEFTALAMRSVSLVRDLLAPVDVKGTSS